LTSRLVRLLRKLLASCEVQTTKVLSEKRVSGVLISWEKAILGVDHLTVKLVLRIAVIIIVSLVVSEEVCLLLSSKPRELALQ
jgi:hypothetical protein